MPGVAATRARALVATKRRRTARRWDRVFRRLALVQGVLLVGVAWKVSSQVDWGVVGVLSGGLVGLSLATLLAWPERRRARLVLGALQGAWAVAFAVVGDGHWGTQYSCVAWLMLLAAYRDVWVVAIGASALLSFGVLGGLRFVDVTPGTLGIDFWVVAVVTTALAIRQSLEGDRDLRKMARLRARAQVKEEAYAERVEERTSALLDERRKIDELNEEVNRKMLRFRSLFKRSPIGTAVIDGNGAFVDWNDSFRALIERCQLDPFERTLTDFVFPQDRPLFNKLLAGASESTGCEDPRDVRLGLAHIAVTQCCITTLGEAVDGDQEYLALFRDVTDQRNSAIALERVQMQLQSAQKLEAIGQLAAGVAHEINTPAQYVTDNVTFLRRAFAGVLDALEATVGCVEAAKAGEPAPADVVKAAARKLRQAKLDFVRAEAPKAIEQSLEGLQRISSIVRAMKEFSHPSQGKKTLVNLNEAIATTLTVARNEWKYVADIETEFDPTLPPVPCLRDEFNQVILNLVVNAAHAIADAAGPDPSGKGAIKISTRRDGRYVRVQVADTGKGIPQAVRERVFEPFFTTKEVGRGTGQGLAIAYSVVVDKHHGVIDFDSKEGVGTTFTILLPLADDQADAA